MSAIDLFRRWFVAPIEKIEPLSHGDGGIVAFMVAIPLYERALKGRIKLRGEAATDAAFYAEIERDLGITEDVRRRFVVVLRNGFMHQAMPQEGKTKWIFSHTFSDVPRLETRDGTAYVCIDPWAFTKRTLSLFETEPRLITVSESYPFADIFEAK